jgi:hypothetical protein
VALGLGWFGGSNVYRFLISSPPGLAGPAAHETLLLCGRVVGIEVGHPLVRSKPEY